MAAINLSFILHTCQAKLLSMKIPSKRKHGSTEILTGLLMDEKHEHFSLGQLLPQLVVDHMPDDSQRRLRLWEINNLVQVEIAEKLKGRCLSLNRGKSVEPIAN